MRGASPAVGRLQALRQNGAGTWPSRNQPTKSTSRTDAPNPRKIAAAVASVSFAAAAGALPERDQHQIEKSLRTLRARAIDGQEMAERGFVVGLTDVPAAKPGMDLESSRASHSCAGCGRQRRARDAPYRP